MTELTDAVSRLRDRYPHIGPHGLQPLGLWHNPLSLPHLHERAEAHRGSITVCRSWLRDCSHTKHITPRLDTYAYKHELENALGVWVPHFAMLVAAELEGLDMRSNPDRPWAACLPLGTKRPGALS